MHVGSMMGNAFAIVFFFTFIGAKFMNPGYLLKWGYFLILFGVQFLFILFLRTANGIGDLAPLICCVALSFLINIKEKNYIKSFNIAFTILIALLIVVYVLGTFIAAVFPSFYSFEGFEYNAVIAICVFASAFILSKYKDFFFNQVNDKKILMFNLLFKIFTFIFVGIGFSILSTIIRETVYLMTFGAVLILAIAFFISKFNSKLISKLESEKQIALIRNTEAENINKKYDDIIRLKHYYTNLFRSSIGFIEADDMTGMKEYFKEHIAPINEDLNKELSDYKQIELMEIKLIKSRLLELVNTVSLIPNAKLIININDIINNVAMKDIDLFAILNIYIENAVDEIREQEKGEIKIEITKTHESVIFVICNSLVGYDSSPKSKSLRKGRKITREIFIGYPNTRVLTSVKFGSYEQLVEVFNDRPYRN